MLVGTKAMTSNSKNSVETFCKFAIRDDKGYIVCMYNSDAPGDCRCPRVLAQVWRR